MVYGESGNKYYGQWKNNLKDGIGIMTFGTNAIYTDRFTKGKRYGEGVYKYLKIKDLYSGSWKNGLKHGKGTFNIIFYIIYFIMFLYLIMISIYEHNYNNISIRKLFNL